MSKRRKVFLAIVLFVLFQELVSGFFLTGFMIASFVFPIYLTLKIVEILADRHGVDVSFRIVEKIDALILSIFSKNYDQSKSTKKHTNNEKSSYQEESGNNFYQYQFNKGVSGEANIFYVLESLPYDSKIMTNLYVPTRNGTTEIDLVYICPWGIYVIESKNYSGWIFGNEKQKYWTHVLYNKKYKFLNPILQNKFHIKQLSKAMNLPQNRLQSLVVFGNNTEFKNLSVDRKKVIQTYQLKDYMEKYRTKDVFSKSDMDTIYRYLQRFAYKTDEEKSEHIKNLRSA